MNALPRGRSNTVCPWLLDPNLVYAITAQKSVPHETYMAAYPKTRVAGSTELGTLTTTEVTQLTGVASRDLLLLVNYGVLSRVAAAEDPWEFEASLVPVLRRAQRLREDLALNKDGFALVTLLLMAIDKIEAELRFARLSGRSGIGPVFKGAPAEDPNER